MAKILRYAYENTEVADLERGFFGAVRTDKEIEILQSDPVISIVNPELLLDAAKKEIAQLLKEKKMLRYSDILELTPFNLDTIIQACEELKSEKKIKEV